MVEVEEVQPPGRQPVGRHIRDETSYVGSPDGPPPALVAALAAAPAGMPPPAAILRLSEETVFASSVAEM